MKIAFSSTHCTGKSTLVRELEKYNLKKDGKSFIFYKDVSKKLNQEFNIPLNERSSLKGQILFLSERLKEIENPNFVADRSLYDSLAYALCSNDISDKDKLIYEYMCIEYLSKYDLIIHTNINDIKVIEDNNVRSTDSNYRIVINNKLEELYKKYPPKMSMLVSGSVQERIDTILSFFVKQGIYYKI